LQEGAIWEIIQFAGEVGTGKIPMEPLPNRENQAKKKGRKGEEQVEAPVSFGGTEIGNHGQMGAVNEGGQAWALS